MPVQTGQRHNFVLGHDVENAIRKSAQERSPNVAVDDCEGERVALDCFETLIKCLKELVTKFVTSLSVPRENTLHVRFRCGREAQDHFLRDKKSRTCAQGRAA